MSRTSKTGPAKVGGRAGSSPLRNPRLLLPLAVIVLGIGYYALQWWQTGAAVAERRARLIADALAEVAKEEPEDGRLSQLMAGLKRQPDHESAPEVLDAMARIELVRDRAERAWGLFGSVAARPGATPAAQRLGARILLRRHEGFGGQRSAAAAMLEQVVSFAEAAYRDGSDPVDLFRAWQAAKRLWDHDRAKAIAARLQAAHATSHQARLAALMAQPDPLQDADVIHDLEVDFSVAPAELAALSTLVELQAGRVPQAVKMAEAALNRTPGVWITRDIMAIVDHTCALASADQPDDRARWLQRRDAQLDWLLAAAPAEDKLRARWTAMRSER